MCEQRSFQFLTQNKKNKEILVSLPEGWDVIEQDESIFIYDAIVRKVWALKGSKPRVKVTGSHQKSFVFGALSLSGRQLFRQYSEMNSGIFIAYLKCLKRKFKKFFFIMMGLHIIEARK